MLSIIENCIKDYFYTVNIVAIKQIFLSQDRYTRHCTNHAAISSIGYKYTNKFPIYPSFLTILADFIEIQKQASPLILGDFSFSCVLE